MAEALAQIKIGHLGMAGCCTCYLIWWAIFFWPKVEGGEAAGIWRPIGVIALLGAVGFGFWGACQIAGGARALAPDAAVVAAVSGGIALYLLLLLVTTRIFQRVPTTELVLFCAWLALELFCAAGLARAGMAGSAALLAILAVAGFIVSLVCYIRYYRLPPLASFICGCIPLASIGVISLIASLAL